MVPQCHFTTKYPYVSICYDFIASVKGFGPEPSLFCLDWGYERLVRRIYLNTICTLCSRHNQLLILLQLQI